MKPIRVALSGSGFRFPAHAGALHAIRDAGFKPVQYAGTSGGSIIAALAACGMDLDEMKELTLTHDWSGMMSFSLWALFDGAYCSGDALHNWIDNATLGKRFSGLNADLVIMASDVAAEQPYEFSSTKTPSIPVSLAARASASIPFVYKPVEAGNALLMDGGIVNNIPVDKLMIDDIPRLGVQLTSVTTPWRSRNKTLFNLVPRVFDLLFSANENTHVELDKAEGAHFAFVECGYASSLDRNMSGALRLRLFNDGYAATRRALMAI
jgi:NTE family protein